MPGPEMVVAAPTKRRPELDHPDPDCRDAFRDAGLPGRCLPSTLKLRAWAGQPSLGACGTIERYAQQCKAQ
jgi:hypothetical protein